MIDNKICKLFTFTILVYYAFLGSGGLSFLLNIFGVNSKTVYLETGVYHGGFIETNLLFRNVMFVAYFVADFSTLAIGILGLIEFYNGLTGDNRIRMKMGIRLLSIALAMLSLVFFRSFSLFS